MNESLKKILAKAGINQAVMAFMVFYVAFGGALGIELFLPWFALLIIVIPVLLLIVDLMLKPTTDKSRKAMWLGSTSAGVSFLCCIVGKYLVALILRKNPFDYEVPMQYIALFPVVSALTYMFWERPRFIEKNSI